MNRARMNLEKTQLLTEIWRKAALLDTCRYTYIWAESNVIECIDHQDNTIFRLIVREPSGSTDEAPTSLKSQSYITMISSICHDALRLSTVSENPEYDGIMISRALQDDYKDPETSDGCGSSFNLSSTYRNASPFHCIYFAIGSAVDTRLLVFECFTFGTVTSESLQSVRIICMPRASSASIRRGGSSL